MSDDDSTRHYGAALLAIAALSTLSVFSAGKIGEAMQDSARLEGHSVDRAGITEQSSSGSRYSARSVFTTEDELDLSMDR